MSRIFYRKKFSDYLGEQRAIDDIITFFTSDPLPSPTPTPSNTPFPLTQTPTPTVSVTVTPTPSFTATPTLTQTPTRTPSVTSSPTASVTSTPTLTPTNTQTPTPTNIYALPSSIAGLFCWYDLQDAGTITLSGSDILQIDDKSINGYDLIPIATPPTYINSTITNLYPFKAMYDFQGLNEMRANISSVPFNEGTHFAVVGKTNTQNNVIAIHAGGSVPSIATTDYAGIQLTNTIAFGANNGTRSNVSGIQNGESLFLTTYGNTGTTLTTFIDYAVTQNSTGFTTGSTTSTVNKISVGGVTSPGSPSHGVEVLEVFSYNRILTPTEYNGLINYLKQKYSYATWIAPLPTPTPTNTPTLTPTPTSTGAGTTPTPTPTPTATQAGFTPASIPNLKSWHDASVVSSLTIIGGEVDIWNDISGNGYNLQAPSSGDRPTYSAKTLNGIAVVSSLTPTKQLYRSNYGLNPQISGGTVFIVGAQNAGDTGYGRFVDADFATGFWTGRFSLSPQLGGAFLANLAPYGSFVDANDGQFNIISLSANTTDSNIVLNNAEFGSPFTYVSGSYANNGLSFYSAVAGSFRGAKDIAEVIIYDRTLTPSESTQIYDYLNKKWNTVTAPISVVSDICGGSTITGDTFSVTFNGVTYPMNTPYSATSLSTVLPIAYPASGNTYDIQFNIDPDFQLCNTGLGLFNRIKYIVGPSIGSGVWSSTTQLYSGSTLVYQDTSDSVSVQFSPYSGYGQNYSVTLSLTGYEQFYVHPTFDVDATNYINAVIASGGTLNGTQQTAINTLFTNLKSAGLYSKIDIMYPMLGGNGNGTSINAITPSGSFNITWNGGMSFTSSGATGNGTNSYGNTNYNPNTSSNPLDYGYGVYMSNSGNYDLEIYNLGAYDGTNITAARAEFGEVNLYGYSVGEPRTSMVVPTAPDLAGNYISTFSSTSYKQNYFNYNSVSISATSTPVLMSSTPTLVNQPIYTHTLNINGSPYNLCTATISFLWFGKYLTNSQVSTLSTIINNFQTALGRNTY